MSREDKKKKIGGKDFERGENKGEKKQLGFEKGEK